MALKKIILLILLVPVLSFAAPWKIIPAKSSITFTATQNNAPVTGTFTAFTGDIDFDPAQLNSSSVKIIVDMSSVTTSYKDIADTLKTADWFDIKNNPTAVFTANKFKKINDNNYQADGMLTIRNKTLPVTLLFTLEKYSNNDALVKGSTELKRTLFGVGIGQWASTDTIKDDVKVDFVLAASK